MKVVKTGTVRLAEESRGNYREFNQANITSKAIIRPGAPNVSPGTFHTHSVEDKSLRAGSQDFLKIKSRGFPC